MKNETIYCSKDKPVRNLELFFGTTCPTDGRLARTLSLRNSGIFPPPPPPPPELSSTKILLRINRRIDYVIRHE